MHLLYSYLGSQRDTSNLHLMTMNDFKAHNGHVQAEAISSAAEAQRQNPLPIYLFISSLVKPKPLLATRFEASCVILSSE